MGMGTPRSNSRMERIGYLLWDGRLIQQRAIR
jgi:hypothetical protein